MIMRYLISTICIALLMWGCDNTTAVPAKPIVVRKKIVAPKDNTAKVRMKKSARTAQKKPAAKQPTKTVVARIDKTQADAKRPPAKTAVAKVDKTKPGAKTPPARTPVAKLDKAQPGAKTPPAKTPVAKVDKTKPGAKTTPVKAPVAKLNNTQADAKKRPAANKNNGPQPLMARKEKTKPVQNAQPLQVKQKKPAISPKSELTAIKKVIKKDKQTQPDGKKAVAADKLVASTSVTAPKMLPGGIPARYDPTGKIDPFEPLYKEKSTINRKKKQIKRAPRTPLERIDLSQLKLVGIILAASGNRALVEESNGKGYVIKKGTYIGVNGGKIVNINREIVTVEEQFEDVFGKIQTRNRELKLPKPPGEF